MLINHASGMDDAELALMKRPPSICEQPDAGGSAVSHLAVEGTLVLVCFGPLISRRALDLTVKQELIN
jgi:hypothetical protein